MAYEPLHHKYRPQRFNQLVGQNAIATTLSNALNQRRIAPAYLFCGPRGTGKTSSARILAKSLNCIHQDHPTPEPCGTCETCRSITNGSALDFIEIDAASNTGVDNIRELIERAQFAPVQCRYKVYVIDECLTGDALVLTADGPMRIDDPTIEGKQVLSYNEASQQWEFKRAVRWLDQGVRPILDIQTTHRRIRCTENHLIRTTEGWIAAGELQAGHQILSPAPVDAVSSSLPLVPTTDRAALFGDTNLRATPTAKSLTALSVSLSNPNLCAPSVNAAAVKGLVFRRSFSKRGEVSRVSSPIGNDIPTKNLTVFGRSERIRLSVNRNAFRRKSWGLSTAPFWATDPLSILIPTAAFPDWFGHTVSNSKLGWNTKPLGSPACEPSATPQRMRDTAKLPFVAAQSAIPTWSKFSIGSEDPVGTKPSPKTGYPALPQRAWPGGTWTMDPSAVALKAAPESSFTPKAIPSKKTTSLQTGLPGWDMSPRHAPTQELVAPNSTSTSPWVRSQPASCWPTCNNSQSQPWITNLETVVSVRPAGVEAVYDIEVEDNHNFVANGLLVHNCHMLSTAAFNALLKTLEEPPSNVVFVLATTDPQRVLPTIISRCQRFDYRRIPLEPMILHLRNIATQEAIAINDEALRLVAQVAQGGLRDAQSLLDQLSLLEPPVTADAVWDLVGAVPERDLLTLVQAILTDDSSTVLDQARKLMDRGREPLIVLQNLAGFYRDLLIAKTAAGRQDLVAITPSTWAEMQTLVQGLEPSLLLMGQQHLRSAEAQVKNTTQPRLWLEVTLLGLLPSTLATQVTTSPAMGIAPRPVVPPQPTAPASEKPVTPSAPPSTTTFTPPPTPAPPPDPSTSEQPPANHPAEPTPVPVSDRVPPPPSNGQGATVANADLPHLWAQVIAVLEPLGTRALMLQQGSLVFFDGTVARVGISSRPLFKMAQGRVENVEAAFQKVLNRKVVVSLEVLPDPKPDPPAPNISQASGQGVAEPPTTPYTPYPPTDVAPAPSVNSPQATEPTASVPTSAPVAPVPTTGDSTSPASPMASAAADPMASAMPTMPPLPEIASDFDRAVKNFAQFFNGQVVDIDDDLEALLGGPSPKPSKAAAHQPSHPDKDVPF